MTSAAAVIDLSERRESNRRVTIARDWHALLIVTLTGTYIQIDAATKLRFDAPIPETFDE